MPNSFLKIGDLRSVLCGRHTYVHFTTCSGEQKTSAFVYTDTICISLVFYYELLSTILENSLFCASTLDGWMVHVLIKNCYLHCSYICVKCHNKSNTIPPPSVEAQDKLFSKNGG